MEKILEQILQEIRTLKEGQNSLEKRFDRLEKRFVSFEERFDSLEKRFDSLEKRFDSLEKRFDSLEDNYNSLKENQRNIEIQLNENTQIIKALLHRTEELDAKFDGLLHTTATKEALDKLATKEDIAAQFAVLNARLFQNEVEVQRLKAIK